MKQYTALSSDINRLEGKFDKMKSIKKEIETWMTTIDTLIEIAGRENASKVKQKVQSLLRQLKRTNTEASDILTQLGDNFHQNHKDIEKFSGEISKKVRY